MRARDPGRAHRRRPLQPRANEVGLIADGRDIAIDAEPVDRAARELRLRPLLLPKVSESAVVASGWARRDRLTRRLYACADGLGITVAMVAAAALTDNRSDLGELGTLIVLTLPAWVLIFKLYGLYDRALKRISHSVTDDLPWLFHALLVGGLGFWGLVRWLPLERMILLECVLFGLLALVLLPLLRHVVNVRVAGHLGPERLLLVGEGPVIEPLLQVIERHAELGLEPIGLLDRGEGQLRLRTLNGAHANGAQRNGAQGYGAQGNGAHGNGDLGAADPVPLGSFQELDRVIVEHEPERVFICRDAFDSDQVLELIDTCRRFSLKVGLLPDAVETFGPSVEVDEVRGIAVLGMSPPVLTPSSRLLKRVFDLAIASSVLLLTAPLLLACALAIRLTSPGPVIFRQLRIGSGGHRFHVFKLRTMYEDAEERREKLMSASKDARWLQLDSDPRVTAVGRLLRGSSLDELPQLLNVLRGEMSIVGPRPLPPYEDVNVAGWGRGRLDLTPGMTGLWQVLGRTRIPFDEMVKLDYLYVTNWSLWLDIRLLLRTVPAIVSGRSKG